MSKSYQSCKFSKQMGGLAMKCFHCMFWNREILMFIGFFLEVSNIQHSNKSQNFIDILDSYRNLNHLIEKSCLCHNRWDVK